MPQSTSELPTMQLIYLWLIPLLLSLILLPSFGTGDMQVWLNWGQAVLQHGIIDGFKASGTDYPPGSTLLIYLSLMLSKYAGFSEAYLGIKCILWLAVWGSTYLLWRWSRQQLIPLLGFAYFCYSALAQGYLDVWFGLFIIAALYFLQQRKLVLALLAYAAAVYTKFPALIIGPFLAVYLLKSYGFRTTFKVALPAIAFIFLANLPFGLETFYAYKRVLGHQALSFQALNLNWIFSRNIISSDGTWGNYSVRMLLDGTYPHYYKWLSLSLFWSSIAAALAVMIKYQKSLELTLACAFIGYFSYFMLVIGSHENHLFLSCVLLMALCCINFRQWIGVCFLICGVSSINIMLFYGLLGHKPQLFSGFTETHMALESAGSDGTLKQVVEKISDEFGEHILELIGSMLSHNLFELSPYPIDLHLAVAAFNLVIYGCCWITVLRRAKALASITDKAVESV